MHITPSNDVACCHGNTSGEKLIGYHPGAKTERRGQERRRVGVGGEESWWEERKGKERRGRELGERKGGELENRRIGVGIKRGEGHIQAKGV